MTDGRSAPTAAELPAEVLCHAFGFLGLGGLARASVVCVAFHGAASSELRREREERDALARLWDGHPGPHPHAGLLTVRGAVDACRRWGLPAERPFRGLARRAERRWVVEMPCYPHRTHDRCSVRAPVSHPLPAASIRGGETMCVRIKGCAPLCVPVDINADADVATEYPVATNGTSGHASLSVPMRTVHTIVRDGVLHRVSLSFVHGFPRDPTVDGPLDGRAHASREAHLAALARYAARLERAWGLPDRSVLYEDVHGWDGFRWRLADDALYGVALRHYDREGVPSESYVYVAWQYVHPPATR